MNKSPFDEGLTAFRERIPRERCAYPEDSVQRRNWEIGWDLGRSIAFGKSRERAGARRIPALTDSRQ
jgi:hypothetical protein